jgi:hypothetical protein
MKRASLLLAALMLLFSPATPNAQELGRLFFTPEQRAALDARRRARIPDRAASPALISPTTRLDGYVKRTDGLPTVWVNGESTQDAAPAPDGRVAVPAGESGARVQLRPGEVLDRSSGEVRDVLGTGQLRVQPRSK